MTSLLRRMSPRASLAALLLLLGLAAPLGASPQPNDDALTAQRRIEAAYLYKFGAYITWPDNTFAASDSPIVIGVAGADALADDLTALVAGRKAGDRPVVVKKLQPGDSLAGIDIVFVGAKADALIGDARSLPVLVVVAGEDGLQRGAMVSFVLVDDRVRFDVALDPVQRSGLKLSSQLLSVAHSVSGAQP